MTTFRFVRRHLMLLVAIVVVLGGELGPAAQAPNAFAQKGGTTESGTPGPGPLVIGPTESTPDAEAIRDLIAKTNYHQMAVIASGDPQLPEEIGTDRYNRASQRANEELLASGAISIELVELEWGTIVITGDTAVATTHETWAITTGAGRAVQASELNVYELVVVDGVWKIDADVHPEPVRAPVPAPRR